MSGWKKWAALEVVQATQFQDYVQDQVVQVYAGTAARSSALGTSVTEGMVSYLSDINSVQVYDGSSWIAVGGTAVAYATASGTAVYATNAGTSVYATNAGTADYSVLSGTANYSTTSGTSVYATTSGTADYSVLSGTAVYATNAGTSVYATTSGTADYSVLSGTAVNVSGTVSANQVSGTAIFLNGTAILIGGSATVTGGGGTADFSNPMTVLGDLIVGGTGGAAERLGIGSANTFLFSNGTVASWNTVGTAGYSTTSGTAVYATNAGTSVYATNAGTSVYATTSGTSVSISGNIAPSQITAGTFNAGSFTFSTAVTTGNTLTTGNAMRNITMSTADPSGGADGDVWLKYTP